MSQYQSVGKQVLRGRAHVADAIDIPTAQKIVEALNTIDEMESDAAMTYDPYTDPDTQTPGHHAVMAQGDEYACACGMRWDRADGPEHP